MSNYINKKTTITEADLSGVEQDVTVNEALVELKEQEEPSSKYYRGVIDAVFDLDNLAEGLEIEKRDFTDPDYKKGYDDAMALDARQKRIARNRQRLADWKKEHNK